MRSKPTRTQTWGPTSKTWLILAKDGFWRCYLRQAVSHLSDSWWLHPSSTRSSPSDIFFLAIWDVGNGCHWTHKAPPTFKGHRFIMAITDCFSKWVKVIPFREVKTSDMVKFIKQHIIYYFGIPRWIFNDNGPQFVSQVFQRCCNKLRIQSVSSTTYYLAANSLTEAFNKSIDKLLK